MDLVERALRPTERAIEDVPEVVRIAIAKRQLVEQTEGEATECLVKQVAVNEPPRVQQKLTLWAQSIRA